MRLLLAALLWTHAAAAAGTLRLLATESAGTIDPHLNYTAQYWQVFSFVYDGLVAFRKLPVEQGQDIVPDLAAALPTIEDGGRLYRFRLRPGLRFSDGTPLTPADVLASLRRIFKVHGPTADTFYGAIDGAPACLHDPDTCTLEGVAADGDTITIRLSRPDPEFLQKLALPHASILPAATPARDVGVAPVPGTGPYRIAAYDPGEGMTLERNPNFAEWSHAAQPAGIPDSIDYQFGLEGEAEVTAVENGQADWMFDTPPADRLSELGELARLNPAPALWFVPLNVHVPPFDDPRIRRAFNLAVDRAAIVRLAGGPRLAAPTCQVLPPGLLGYAPYCPYPHDPEAARRLVAVAGATGTTVTLVIDDSPAQFVLGSYLRDVLASLGFTARLRVLSGAVQFPYIQNSANRVQASITSWYADYPSPANFLLGVFGCAAFHPASDSSPNIAGWCDPAFDARVAAAIAARDAPALAAADRALTDAGPFVALFTPAYVDLVARHVRGYAYHPLFHFLIDQASSP